MVSRREFVVGGVAVAATAGIAGCSRLPFVGGAGYADWTPARDSEYVQIIATRPADMAEVDDLEEVDEEYRWDVDPADVDFHLESFSGWSVTEGDLSMSDVEDTLDADLESGGGHAGYDRYSDESVDVEVAFDDGTVVAGRSASVVEDVVDAGEGDGDRLVDEHDDVGRVRDVIDDGDAVILGAVPEPAEDDEEVAWGISFDFAEGQSDLVYAIVYRDEDVADEEQLREDLEDDDAISDLSVSRDGRVVEVSASFETSEY